MLQRPVDEGEERRRVVELDVAGEGRISGEDDGGREHGEDHDRRSHRPRIDPRQRPRHRAREAEGGDREHCRKRQAGALS